MIDVKSPPRFFPVNKENVFFCKWSYKSRVKLLCPWQTNHSSFYPTKLSEKTINQTRLGSGVKITIAYEHISKQEVLRLKIFSLLLDCFTEMNKYATTYFSGRTNSRKRLSANLGIWRKPKASRSWKSTWTSLTTVVVTLPTTFCRSDARKRFIERARFSVWTGASPKRPLSSKIHFPGSLF